LSGRLNVFSLDFDVPDEGIKGTFRKEQKLEGEKSSDTIDKFEKQYHWQEMPKTATQEQGFIIRKSYPITALTDFDFAQISNKKEIIKTIQKDLAINEEINLGENIILILIRGDKDNPWPIYGYVTVRNFMQVLQFLADSLIKDQPGYSSEYNVDPSKFTNDLLNNFNNNISNNKDSNEKEMKLKPGCLDNPALTLTIASGMTSPRDRLVDIDYNGESFWISPLRDQTGAQSQSKEWFNPYPKRWNSEIFSMLYEIFQFNRIEPAVSTPSISISK
jgi:hypothetical protein